MPIKQFTYGELASSVSFAADRGERKYIWPLAATLMLIVII